MPGSIAINDLLSAYRAYDFGARPGNWDAGPKINQCIDQAVAFSLGEAVVHLDPGVYHIGTAISVPSNVTLEGAGRSTVLRLLTDAGADVIRSVSTSGVRIRNLRIDGNRANNSSGNQIGVYLSDVADAWIENVEVISCRADGFQLNQCNRVELRGCRASDNGRHGISLNATEFCLLFACRSFSNSQTTSGAADGFNLDVLSHDNVVIAPLAYDSALAGSFQAYGVRELSAGGCYRNLVIGNPQGNQTAAFLTEPDSMALGHVYTMSQMGVGTASPNAAALLDLTSTRQGVLIPRLTTAQRDGIASPPAGLMIYNTTTNKINLRAASAWEAVTSA